MITRKELEAKGKMLGFNAYQAEKDYLQHAFLASLYSVSSSEFVFKGGTALQKAYGLDRFSEDLDFTFSNGKPVVFGFIEKAANGMDEQFETTISKREEKMDSLSARLKLKGPLFEGNAQSIQTLLVEVSIREKILKAPVARRIVPQYPDLRAYVALCMDLDEILAEKIRAILTREKPRDVYDAWFLSRKGAVFRADLADGKLAYYGKRYEAPQFKKGVLDKRKLWEKEMNVLLRNAPPFEDTASELLEWIGIRWQ